MKTAYVLGALAGIAFGLVILVVADLLLAGNLFGVVSPVLVGI